jgi:hypothetical protein
VQRYFNLFSPDQIKIYLYDDLVKDAIGTIQDIYRFLEIDASFVPDMSIRENSTGIPKNKALNTFLHNGNLIKTCLKPLLPTPWRKQMIANLNQRNLKKEKLSPDIRRQLLPLFQTEIEQLQTLLQRDLSSWLRC